MNKLEEMMTASQNEGSEDTYECGFYAAIALDLPAKFATWKHNHPFDNKFHNKALWDNILKWNNLKPPNISELYQYWITHIYKPE